MRRKLKLDFITQVIFALIKPVAFMLVIKMAGVILNPYNLGLFLFCRRLSSTGGALFQLGSTQTLMRYFSMDQSDSNKKTLYILSSLFFFLTLTIGSFSLLYIFKSPIEKILFSGIEYSEGFPPWILGLLLAYVLNCMLMAILISERKLITLNIIQMLVGSGFVLLYFFLYAGEISVLGIIKYETVAIFLLSVTLFISLLYNEKIKFSFYNKKDWFEVIRTYFNYGLSRGMVSALDMLLFLIGSWLVKDDMAQVGNLLISMASFKLIQVVMLPIGQLSGVVLTQSSGDKSSLRKGITLLVGGCIVLIVPILSVVVPWMNELLSMWVGESSSVKVASFLMIIIWATLPYALYQGLYVTIDMLWKSPKNLYSLTMAISIHLIVFLALSQFVNPQLSVAIAFLVAVFFLGAKVLLDVSQYLTEFPSIGLMRFISLVGSLFYINNTLADVGGMGAFALSAVISFVGLLMYVFIAPPPFVNFARNLLVAKKRGVT